MRENSHVPPGSGRKRCHSCSSDLPGDRIDECLRPMFMAHGYSAFFFTVQFGLLQSEQPVPVNILPAS